MNQPSLAVPRFVVPVAEPRVLLTVDNDKKPMVVPSLLTLDFTTENLSMYYLTFNLQMYSSEDFAFSGPNVSTTSLLPISRHVVKYRVLPIKRREWVKVKLEVADSYFGRSLKIQAASAFTKADQKNNVYVWVP